MLVGFFQKFLATPDLSHLSNGLASHSIKKPASVWKTGLNLWPTEGYLVDLLSGPDRDRTDDLLNAIQALSQLSYGPVKNKILTHIWFS